MRVVHISDTEFTTLPESLPVLARLEGSQIVLTLHGRESKALDFYTTERKWEQRALHVGNEYRRFMEWLRSGDENSEFRFVLKVPAAEVVQDTPAFLSGAVPVVPIGPIGRMGPIEEPLPVAAEVAAGAVIFGELPESYIPHPASA